MAFCMASSWHWQIALFYLLNRIITNLQLVQHTNPKLSRLFWGEIADGNYVVTDIKPTIISTLGAIPKPDSSEVQLIHDCCRPPGQALNDYISCSNFRRHHKNAITKLFHG